MANEKQNNDTHYVDVHVGKRLRMRRKVLGLSQEKLGNSLPETVTFQQIQKYENGVNRIAASRLYHLAKVLGVEPAWFFIGLEGEEATTVHSDSPIARDPPENLPDIESNESIALVRAYYSIKSEKKRKSVIDLIKSLASANKVKKDSTQIQNKDDDIQQ